MRRVIKGIVYDTKKARVLATWSTSELDSFDAPDCFEEHLHITKTGKFFLYGVGGGNTPYGRPCADGSRIGGEKIRPLTREEADTWALESLAPEEHKLIFEEINTVFEEREPKERVNLMLDPWQLEGLRQLSEVTGLSMSHLVGDALQVVYDEEFERLLTGMDGMTAEEIAAEDAEVLAAAAKTLPPRLDKLDKKTRTRLMRSRKEKGDDK